jgi:hypothetical protein
MVMRDWSIIGAASFDLLTPMEQVCVLNVLAEHPRDQALVTHGVGREPACIRIDLRESR